MSKIRNIVEGFTKETPVNEEWYLNRKALCDGCEFNTLNGASLSIACKTIKSIGCASSEKGSCNQCCCCIEQKTIVKAESCPKGKWGSMLINSKEFKLEMETPAKVKLKDGNFEVDLGMVDTDNLNISFETTSISKTLHYVGARAGCSCTSSMPKELYKGRSYKHSVNISLSVYGQQNKSLELNFVGNGNITYTLPIKFKFNRINTQL